MKILVLSQYFWPESFIINDVVRTLDEQGHEVVVSTGKPNYPDGKIFDGYSAKGTQYERYLGNIDVLRVPLWPRGEGGAKNLILNYLSFVLAGLLFLPWMLRKREFDAILVFAPSPILQAIPAIPLKWLKKAKLALWVQDLWPESLKATGFISNPHALRAVGWLVKGIYRFCDILLVQSRAFFEPVSRYADLEKIVYYPNSIDANSPVDRVPIPAELSELLEQHFCVVFAGNLGTAQALDTLVQAAVHLRDDAQVRLVIVGSGSRLAWLKSQQQALGLGNLILAGRFAPQAMPQIFEKSSALLVSLNDNEAFAQTVPSKIQGYLAAGRPILASINGEGARVVLEAGAGLTSAAEQVLPLVENIRRLQALSVAEREAMGKSGRDYFDVNFDMPSQVKSLVRLLS
ncbi:glycosyltransferase family 4 protein [Pseudomonas anguilliseptica]|uniref:Glycosyltransferase involved in cell wall bisynthesis n=1 Tax=Pseudomonas anguilliseptica TaxID=53406 RepID=A0A1H5ITD2_PSEAG|nr:glycosyltransferase family 4 protein [Pseudomonas anguilliseptica]SEE43390.1 Glycosyltransferase involved in cell wall bisynthesis [Pseudomonas anguilliseptica]